MKIEKINERQIRCTLTSEDLARRQLKLSELAYGTDKAKDLFRDMMAYAHEQFGFDTDNIPLMIEAMPVAADGLVLLITKVEDPEELDTRFSRFTQEKNPSGALPPEFKDITGADDILDLFQKLCEGKLRKASQRREEAGQSAPVSPRPAEDSDRETAADGAAPDGTAPNIIRLFTFPHLDAVIAAAGGLGSCTAVSGSSALYKDNRQNYLLVLQQADCPPELFNKICNILSEYGHGEAFTAAGEAHLREHAQVLVARDALEKLGSL